MISLRCLGGESLRQARATIESRDKLLLSRLELFELLETNFAVVHQQASLKDLARIISKFSRNLFPVVDDELEFVGVVHLKAIRSIMFDQTKYETIQVKYLLQQPNAVVDLTENLHEVLAKIEAPENGIYLSSIMSGISVFCPSIQS
jgi:CIC family chloride channel protein